MSRTSKTTRTVCRLAAFAALLTVSAWPAVASGAPSLAAGADVSAVAAVPAAVTPGATPATATTATPTSMTTLTLTRFTPAVAVPRASITISGTVRNTGSARIDTPTVRVLIGDQGLTSRGSVSAWATGEGEHFMSEAARSALGDGLDAGAAAAFTLVIPATAISHRESFSVLPVKVDVAGSVEGIPQELGGQHTFLPSLSSIKAYEPLSIAWLVPLSLGPDPALHGTASEARTAAWTRAIGAGSRLDRLITGTDRSLVTWAVDPAILGPPPAPAQVDGSPSPSATASGTSTTPTPSSTPSPDGSPGPDPVTEATTALANRLREAAPRHTLWSLPYADPDLASLLSLPSGGRALSALLAHPSALAALPAARTGIAWPVDGTLSTDREQRLRAAFSSSGLAAAVISASTRTARSGYTDDASRKSTGGLPLLAYDQALSRTFAQTSKPATGAVTTQLFLADSLAMLGERPGTRDRSVLVAAPRTFAGDPGVLGRFFSAVAQAPWLTPTSTDVLLASAGTAVPEVPALSPPVNRPPTKTASPTPDPLSPGASPLTEARLTNITRMTSEIDGVASIRDDTQVFRVRWTDAQQQVLSSRWRGHARGITAVNVATRAAIASVSRGVRVVPSSVNFFADRGALQVTVVNDLAVPVHDVHLTLTPGQPRLRINAQTGPLRIGARSRTNVRFNVTAIAAGLVPIEAALTTPNGTPLGQNANVSVRVQPTSTWIYWVLGALAMIILVFGVYRSLRRGTTRASRPPAPKVASDD